MVEPLPSARVSERVGRRPSHAGARRASRSAGDDVVGVERCGHRAARRARVGRVRRGGSDGDDGHRGAACERVAGAQPNADHIFFEYLERETSAKVSSAFLGFSGYIQADGYLRTALLYAINQQDALMRFLDDGRLPMDNSRAERAIKNVALGLKAWLFCGSDDHAKSTAALYSLIASAKLHRIEPEEYLRCLIRLIPLWPEHRMLELAPLFWARTRDRLDPTHLAADFGHIAIPAEPLDTSAPPEQQAAG